MNIYFNRSSLFEINSKKWSFTFFWRWYLGYYSPINKYDYTAWIIGPFQLKIWR